LHYGRVGVLAQWAGWCACTMVGLVCLHNGRVGVLALWAGWCACTMGGLVCLHYGRVGVFALWTGWRACTMGGLVCLDHMAWAGERSATHRPWALVEPSDPKSIAGFHASCPPSSSVGSVRHTCSDGAPASAAVMADASAAVPACSRHKSNTRAISSTRRGQRQCLCVLKHIDCT
jgi:hypothetical protein